MKNEMKKGHGKKQANMKKETKKTEKTKQK
jgi:hypothetical protein